MVDAPEDVMHVSAGFALNQQVPRRVDTLPGDTDNLVTFKNTSGSMTHPAELAQSFDQEEIGLSEHQQRKNIKDPDFFT